MVYLLRNFTSKIATKYNTVTLHLLYSNLSAVLLGLC